MSRHVTVNLLDDWDGTPAAATFEITDDGITYTTDLSRKRAAEFRALIKPFLDRAFDKREATRDPAKTPTKPKRRRRAAALPMNGPNQGLIRAWGREHGYDVKPIGNVPKNVRDAWEAAHNKSA